MDIFQLQYFLSAAITGNFTMAAAENNISQSSFSKHIMALENEMGVKLFYRNRKSISLTPAGERLQKHAYAILGSYKSMMDDMACYSQDDIVISIFSIPVFVQYQIPEIMSAFRALHPQVKFNVVESESSFVLQGLRRLECDFAILRTDFLDEEQYNITPINVDRLVAVVPENHPLAKEKSISVKRLKGEKLLLPTGKASLFDICMAVCKKAGFTPNVPYTVSGKPEISLKFVKNDGVIVLAMEQVMTYFDMPGCVVVPLEEEYLSTTGLVQLKSRETSSITRKFMSFVKEWQKPISEKAGTEKKEK